MYYTSLMRFQEAMQSPSVLPVKAVRQTIDSQDKFAQRLCSLLGTNMRTHKCILCLAEWKWMLEYYIWMFINISHFGPIQNTCFHTLVCDVPSAGVQPSSAAPLLTHASLVAAVEQLAHQFATLEAILSSYSFEQVDLIGEM